MFLCCLVNCPLHREFCCSLFPVFASRAPRPPLCALTSLRRHTKATMKSLAGEKEALRQQLAVVEEELAREQKGKALAVKRRGK